MTDASDLMRIVRAEGLDTPVLMVSDDFTMTRSCLTATATDGRCISSTNAMQ